MNKSEVTVSDLKEYMQMVTDMEKNIYMQSELAYRLQARINNLGVAEKIVKRAPAPTQKAESAAVTIGATLFSLGFFAAIVIGLIKSSWGAFFICLIIGFGSFLVAPFIGGEIDKRNNEEVQARYDSEYHHKIAKD